jgi:hypothetical protein
VIPVVWLDSHILCWDQAMIDAVLSGRMWHTGYTFEHRIGFDGLDADGAVVVIPARYHAHDVDDINAQLARLRWVLVILTSDEERLFPVEKLRHDNMVVWVQTPTIGDDEHSEWRLPVGWPPQVPELLKNVPQVEREDWFFAGQVNNDRRKQCVETLRTMTGGTLIETPGFTQGLEPAEYVRRLAAAKIVPCPSGPQTVDTFRVWEALEAGCIPVVDARTPHADAKWYWGAVAEHWAFYGVREWADFPEAARYLLRGWPAVGNRHFAGWQGYKRRLATRASETIWRLSGIEPNAADDITVLIPTSPTSAHPSTHIIEETVASVRHWLPTADILIMCDGVRPEQEHYRQRYERYLERLLWLCGTKWDRVLPIVHDDHLHQVEMTRRALDEVRTPLVLFVEHDTPLVTDWDIDFPALTTAARSGVADVIRLHHEAHVLPDHQHLMLDGEPQDIDGAPLMRTVQWSQRPHIANTALYRRILAEHFPDGYRGMIEDRMHGVVHSAWRDFGLAGWDRFRLWMYTPPGQIKRSYHLDARADDQKWVDS